MTALRGEVVALASALYVTVPLPDPEAPFVIVSQLALSVAVHAQPAGDVTAIVLVEADGPSVASVGEIA
jgi:hypothetical protein